MFAPWRFARATAAIALAALLLTPLAADAAKKKKDPGKDVAAEKTADKDKPFQDWKKVVKDAEVKTGFFTLYQKRENLYLELRPEQLDKPMLGVFSLASGIGQNFVLGGLPLNDRMLEFQRNGDHILVLEKNVRFLAPAGSAIEKAKDLSHGHSVIASLKIESVHDSSKAVLVDLAPLLVSDLTDLSEWLKQSFQNKAFRFDKERSAIASVKTFPENVEIEALLTYTPGERRGLGLQTVPDERYVPLRVHYSFTKLPDQPMAPRLADDRVGHFITAKKDFGRDQSEHFWVRYAERWRLEKKDPSAALSEPVKPIVFYLDRTIPEKYRPWVKEGVEKWQKAFEAAGFKNAIVALEAPADTNWHAEDARYSTIRWITSHEPSFGAIGPSRVDPRSGEIFDADILFEAAMIQGFRNTYRRYSGPDAIGAQVAPGAQLEGWPASIPFERRCAAGEALVDGGALMHIALLADGAMPPGSPVPDSYMRQALVWVTMHEVGHSLGLRHNFRSSTATPFEKLHDPEWTEAHGLYGSVMEYPTANIASDRSKQGFYYTLGAGDYDVWAIRYSYTPSGAGDLEADYAFARKIADESEQPGHEYSTDEDTYPADALDPRTNTFDLGSDPLAFARERTAFIAGLWSSGRLEDRIIGAEGEYPVLRRAMDVLLGQYATALGQAVKYVGGQEVSRGHKGQPGAVNPLTPVPAARQREALDFLAKRAFAADAFQIAPALLNRLAPDRWQHWGVPSGFGPGPHRLDYDLHNRVLSIQTAVLDRMLLPNLLARVREAESRSAEPYRLAEHFDRLTRAIWGEVGGASALAPRGLERPGTRRDLQRAYVDRLADLVVSPAPRTPEDARALARLQLVRVDSRAARVLAGGAPLGDYTRAHLMETRARIERALEAGLTADSKPRPAAGSDNAAE